MPAKKESRVLRQSKYSAFFLQSFWASKYIPDWNYTLFLEQIQMQFLFQLWERLEGIYLLLNTTHLIL